MPVLKAFIKVFIGNFYIWLSVTISVFSMVSLRRNEKWGRQEYQGKMQTWSMRWETVEHPFPHTTDAFLCQTYSFQGLHWCTYLKPKLWLLSRTCFQWINSFICSFVHCSHPKGNIFPGSLLLTSVAQLYYLLEFPPRFLFN